MLYLMLAVLCSSGTSLSIKYGENHSNNMRAVTAVNYAVAILLCYLFLKERTFIPKTGDWRTTLGLSVINGCLFLATMLLLQWNVKKNGTTISAAFSHLGVLVPTILSIFVFNEYPKKYQWIGVVLAITAIIIINYEGKSSYKSITFKTGLILLFISGGCTDMMSKIFSVFGNMKLEGYFLLYTFCVSFLISVFLAVWKKTRVAAVDFGCGILIGTFNYLSTLFLLKAVMRLPAFLVYPVYSVGVIVFVNIVNYLFMKEPLSKKEFAGMAIISVALVFLNI